MSPSNKFNTPEFKRLKSEWDQKLKDSGFEDAEQPDERLKLWSSQFFRVRQNPVLDNAKEEYYRLAGHFLHDYPFQSELDRAVWSQHAEGVSTRDIADKLKNSEASVKLNKDNVHNIVRKLSRIMVKSWKR